MTYFDSSATMRLIEGAAEQREPLLRTYERAPLTTSVITISECRVKPLRQKNDAALALYDRFFVSAALRIVDVDIPIARKAAEIRAMYGFKLPDSLHLATATLCGCTLVVTSDHDFLAYDGIDGIRIELIPAI